MSAKLRIVVSLDDPIGGYASAGIVVDSLFRRCFEPVDHVDDATMLALVDNAVCDAEMRRVTRMREDAADKLARAIAGQLLRVMSAHDTRNGYPTGDHAAIQGASS